MSQCELLLARFQLVESEKHLSDDVKEMVLTLIWAAPRLGEDVKELIKVKEQFISRYGRKAIEEAMKVDDPQNEGRNIRIVHLLSYKRPTEQEVSNVLSSVAKQYNINWTDESLPLEVQGYVPSVPSADEVSGGASGEEGNVKAAVDGWNQSRPPPNTQTAGGVCTHCGHGMAKEAEPGLPPPPPPPYDQPCQHHCDPDPKQHVKGQIVPPTFSPSAPDLDETEGKHDAPAVCFLPDPLSGGSTTEDPPPLDELERRLAALRGGK
mmetsp:Transcript_37527/g.118359  ORF Transcript_37527/g.118359 Transcript_37527/m.118359 type:complete len:265 (+) Transcript_37527:592-1386(+)